MKAMAISRHGSPDVLERIELPIAVPGDHDLLVKVLYSSINPLDCRIRAHAEYPREYPLILGYDVCGIVEKIGRCVEGIGEEDMIVASPCVFRPGANAEYVLVDGRTAAKVPLDLGPELAAVLPLAGLTAWESLHERAKIEPQQTLLIHAGAGGVGHLAIQLAKASHCRVITTASRPESMDLCQRLGADLVIDYKETDFVSRALDFSEGKGCDAVFDFVGEEVLNQSLDCIRVNGQVVTITPSRIFKDGYGLLLKNLTVHYEFMGVPTVYGLDPRSQGFKLQKLVELAASGVITPHIGHTFAISELPQAHHCQESGASLGKILISNAEWS